MNDERLAQRAMGFTSYEEAYGALSALWALSIETLTESQVGLIDDATAVDELTNYAAQAQQVINSFRIQQ